MLSRTADSLYWIARYMERAENMARILRVADRLTMMPHGVDGADMQEWHSAVVVSGCEECAGASSADGSAWWSPSSSAAPVLGCCSEGSASGSGASALGGSWLMAELLAPAASRAHDQLIQQKILRPYTHSGATSHTASSTTRVHTTAAHTATRRRGPPAALGMVIRVLKTRACARRAVGS